MTLDEIKAAVDAGQTVHWANTGYVVHKDRLGQYLITYGCCHVNSPNLQVGKLFVDQAACAADFHASNASSRW